MGWVLVMAGVSAVPCVGRAGIAAVTGRPEAPLAFRPGNRARVGADGFGGPRECRYHLIGLAFREARFGEHDRQAADDGPLAAEYRDGNTDDAGIDLGTSDRVSLASNGLQGGEELLAGAAEPGLADFRLMLDEQPGEAALREAGEYHLRSGAAKKRHRPPARIRHRQRLVMTGLMDGTGRFHGTGCRAAPPGPGWDVTGLL